MAVLNKFPWYKKYYYAFWLGWHVENSPPEVRDAYYAELKRKAKKVSSK